MLRLVASICIVVLLSGCEKNWRGFVVEKRIYRDGYYVHIPWKRETPKQAYPKPEQYPVDHSRTAATDTSQKNAGGLAGDSRQSNQTGGADSQYGGTGSGLSAGSGADSNQPANGNGGNSGTGNPSYPPPVGSDSPSPPNGTSGYPQTASNSPAPPLQTVPEQPTPPLVRPSYPTAPPSDSAVANNPPPADSVDGNGFDFPEGEFSLAAELGFYNPVYTSGIEIKPFSYNGGVALRYTIHPWSRHKISGESGLFVSHIFIAQDQHKCDPLFIEDHDNERIMQWKLRFLVMDHMYVLRNESAEFDAVEIGMFSDIGIFSTHVAVDTRGNNENAMLTRNKSRLFGLHYLRRMQCGLTARIANDAWSVFASFRFNSLVKAEPRPAGFSGSGGGDLPALVLGATFAIGE